MGICSGGRGPSRSSRRRDRARVPACDPAAGGGANVLTAVVARMGRISLCLIQEMGRMLIFQVTTFTWLVRPPFRVFHMARQLHFIGVKSTFVVVLTAAFTGMVLGLQLQYTLQKFGSEAALGSVVGLTIIRELGPVFAALMVTARAGSAMTAE